MAIQDRIDAVTASLHSRIRNSELPQPVYAAVGAADVVADRLGEVPGRVAAVRQEVSEVPTTLETTVAMRRAQLRDQAAAAPGQVRQSVADAVTRTRSQLQQGYVDLAARGDRRLVQQEAERSMEQGLNEFFGRITPFAARTSVATREAARKARQSPTGQKVAEAAKRAKESLVEEPIAPAQH